MVFVKAQLLHCALVAALQVAWKCPTSSYPRRCFIAKSKLRSFSIVIKKGYVGHSHSHSDYRDVSISKVSLRNSMHCQLLGQNDITVDILQTIEKSSKSLTPHIHSLGSSRVLFESLGIYVYLNLVDSLRELNCPDCMLGVVKDPCTTKTPTHHFGVL